MGAFIVLILSNGINTITKFFPNKKKEISKTLKTKNSKKIRIILAY